MKKLLFIALLSLFIFSCDDRNPLLEPAFAATAIQGNWHWVKSGKIISDQTLEPTTDLIVGNVFIMEHRLEVENSRLTIRVNNDSPSWLAVKESIIEFQHNEDDTERPFLSVGNNQMRAVPDIGGVVEFGDNFIIHEISDERLVLIESGDCTDCWLHTFEKAY